MLNSLHAKQHKAADTVRSPAFFRVSYLVLKSRSSPTKCSWDFVVSYIKKIFPGS